METIKLFDDQDCIIGQLELFDPRDYEERGDSHDENE